MHFQFFGGPRKDEPMWRRISLFAGWLQGGGAGTSLLGPVAGSGIMRLLGMLASFTVGIQLTHELGVTNYGYFSIALAVITLAGIPSEFGLPILMARDVAAASAHGDKGELFGIIRWAERSCERYALAVAVVVIVAALLVRELRSPILGECLLAGAFAIPLIALQRVRSGMILGLGLLVRAQIPEALIRPAFLSIALAVAYGIHVIMTPQLAMALYGVAGAVGLATASLWLRKALPHPPPDRAVARRRSAMASVPMGLSEAVRVIQGEVSIVLAGLVAVPAVVGLLRVANVTAMTAAVPAAIMCQIGMPVMAKLYSTNDQRGLQRTVTALAQVQFAGVVLLGLPLLLFPDFLLGLAFGHGFAAGSGALRFLILGQIMSAAFGLNTWLLNMTHHEKRVLRALGIALAMNIVAVPLFASAWGATGGALALLASMMCWNVISWRDARRLLDIETSIFRWPWRTGAS